MLHMKNNLNFRHEMTKTARKYVKRRSQMATETKWKGENKLIKKGITLITI